MKINSMFFLKFSIPQFVVCVFYLLFASSGNAIGHNEFSPLRGNPDLVQYGSVRCSRILGKNQSEYELVGMALKSSSPQAQLFQLLQDYGVISAPQFKKGLEDFLENYGLSPEQIDLVLAPKPDLTSLAPIYPGTKAEIKEQLEIFQSLRLLGKPGAISNMISIGTAKTLRADAKSPPQFTFGNRFYDFFIDLLLAMISEVDSRRNEFKSKNKSNPRPNQAQIDIQTLAARNNLLLAMDDSSFNQGGAFGYDSVAPLMLALAPLFEHLFAKSAEIIAHQIESALVTNTSVFYNRFVTYPLAGALGLFASSLGLDPLSVFGFHSQGLTHDLAVGIPSAGIGHLLSYAHNPVTLRMARARVRKVLHRDAPEQELKFGSAALAVEELLSEVNSGEKPFGVKIDELCPDQELCRLTPAQISVIGDVEIDFLIEKVDAFAENRKMVLRINAKLQKIHDLGANFVKNFEQTRPQISEEQFHKLAQLRTSLAMLSNAWVVSKNPDKDVVFSANAIFQHEQLKGTVAQKQIALQNLSAAVARVVSETEKDRQLRLFLLAKLADQESELANLTSELLEIDKEWLEWLAAVPKESAAFLNLILNVVVPKYSQTETREEALQNFQDGLEQFKKNLPLRRASRLHWDLQ